MKAVDRETSLKEGEVSPPCPQSGALPHEAVAMVVAAINCLLLLLSMNPSLSLTLQGSYNLLRHTSLGTSAARSSRYPHQKIASLECGAPSHYQFHFPTQSLRAASSSTVTEGPNMSDTTNNKGIIMVLSPAKTLDLTELDTREFANSAVNASTISKLSKQYDTGKCDPAKTTMVWNQMRTKTEGELKKLLKLSDKLARTAKDFWAEFTIENEDEGAFHPAIFTFSGPAFQGLSPSTCDTDTLSYLASNLFILDPVYGALRSLQSMQAYRLEMGVTNLFGQSKQSSKKQSLAAFWKDSMTAYLGNELTKTSKVCKSEGAILVNLASEEYSISIQPHDLPRNTIFLNVIFHTKGRIVSIHAKRARGLMARYLAENNASTLEDIAGFAAENYTCVNSDGPKGRQWEEMDTQGDSVKICRMIFDRDGPPPKEKADSKRPAATKKGGAKKKAK